MIESSILNQYQLRKHRNTNSKDQKASKYVRTVHI